jgi:mannitol/fructose-specific phosphotransferase system IIA component (Ntr-type)
MKITFRDEHIISELKSGNGFEAIDEFVDHLASVGTISAENKTPIATALKQRERSMSTGIGFGLALPHAVTNLVNDLVIAFGRSKTGIDFDALDRQPVRLVVMIIVPTAQREQHLKILAGISRLLHKEEIRAALEAALNSAAMVDILNDRALVSTSR